MVARMWQKDRRLSAGPGFPRLRADTYCGRTLADAGAAARGLSARASCSKARLHTHFGKTCGPNVLAMFVAGRAEASLRLIFAIPPPWRQLRWQGWHWVVPRLVMPHTDAFRPGRLRGHIRCQPRRALGASAWDRAQR